MRVLDLTRVVFVALLLAVLVLVLFSQAKPTRVGPEVAKPTPEPERVADCTLTVDQAPRFRGFYLNQSVEEIRRIFPSFFFAYEKEEDPLMPKRTLTSDFRTVESNELSEDLGQMEDYRDVLFVWQILNGRTVGLTVQYMEFEPASLRDFLTQIAETTSLPVGSFKIVGTHKAVMNCDGFTMAVHEGSYSKTGWVAAGSQIQLEDRVAFEVMAAEEKELKRLAAKEAAKKKEEAEKRKRTFKP